MNTHTDLLNLIAHVRRCKSYLEIGVRNPNDNFNKVTGPALISKTGVDPDPSAHVEFIMTSDEYFESLKTTRDHAQFDLVFIDGLHHAEQVLKDMQNASRILSKDGVMVCHDILPKNEHASRRLQPGEKVIGAWNGDCWKGFAKYCSTTDKKFFTLDFDYGIGVVDFAKPRDVMHYSVPGIIDLHWTDYIANKAQWLNIKPKKYAYEAFLF